MSLNLTHQEGKERLWGKLKELGHTPIKEQNPDLSAKRPIGHSSHNLFVYGKKSKKLYLVAMRQHINTNLKQLAQKLGEKELRFSPSSLSSFGAEKGCLSLLSLYNNTKGDVVPVVDRSLFEVERVNVCVGCDDCLDHSQHNMVQITPKEIQLLLGESNTPQIVFLDFE